MTIAKFKTGGRVKHVNKGQFGKKSTSGSSWSYADLGVSFWLKILS